MLWADLVAVVHALAVVVMVTGGLVALRCPRVLLLHAPVAAVIVAVHLAGAPCPLTELELALRERAGAEPYTGGFLGHYVVAPLGLDVAAPAVQAGIYTVALAPNALAYGLLAARAVGRWSARAGSPATEERAGAARVAVRRPAGDGAGHGSRQTVVRRNPGPSVSAMS